MERRSYVGELEWVVERIHGAVGDQNPNRAAQLRVLLDYGLAVARARRSRESMPPRPDLKYAI